MAFLVRYIFLIYSVIGITVSGVYLARNEWSWTLALENGGQGVLFSVLLISMGITSGIGHVFFGEAIIRGQGQEHNKASRMLQWEIGIFSLIIGLVAILTPVTQQVPLALAWGLFLLAAGIRHAFKKEPLPTVTGDLLNGSLLLAASVPFL